jgi:hypothetical protein
MEKLNYGLALGNNGDWQVTLTVHHPGIRDDFSILLSEPFTYLVAPHLFIDNYFGLLNLSPDIYCQKRSELINSKGDLLKDAILAFHNYQIKKVEFTW